MWAFLLYVWHLWPNSTLLMLFPLRSAPLILEKVIWKWGSRCLIGTWYSFCKWEGWGGRSHYKAQTRRNLVSKSLQNQPSIWAGPQTVSEWCRRLESKLLGHQLFFEKELCIWTANSNYALLCVSPSALKICALVFLGFLRSPEWVVIWLC